MSAKLKKAEQEYFQSLLMKAVDGEITPEERIEFNRLINNYSECQKEWQQYKKLKEVTKTMKFKTLPVEVWDNFWINVYNRLERGVAWILFSIGCMILVTYGSFKAVEAILADSQVEYVVKIGILLTMAGLVILLLSVTREKIFTRKADPYKEVQR